MGEIGGSSRHLFPTSESPARTVPCREFSPSDVVPPPAAEARMHHLIGALASIELDARPIQVNSTTPLPTDEKAPLAQTPFIARYPCSRETNVIIPSQIGYCRTPSGFPMRLG